MYSNGGEVQKIELGLRENWKQFTLLVIINAFVGGMVGLERSILPQIAEQEFHIAAKTAINTFLPILPPFLHLLQFYRSQMKKS